MDQRTQHVDLDLELLLLLELLKRVGVKKQALQRLLNHFKGLKQPKQLSLLQDLLDLLDMGLENLNKQNQLQNHQNLLVHILFM